MKKSKHLGITLLTGKFFKAHKKSAILDHILLDGHKASFDNFFILSLKTIRLSQNRGNFVNLT